MNMKSMLKKFAVTILAMLCLANQAYAGNAMHIVINDHLGTPQMLVDENRNVVWQAEYDEFGKANILVQQVEFNQRFPGQYYDKETGLHYNYYRDYDPALGRYVQSDPIGLAGGINTYGYVLGNPVMYIDPLGLWPLGAPKKGFKMGKLNVPSMQTVTQQLENALIKSGTCEDEAQAKQAAADIVDAVGWSDLKLAESINDALKNNKQLTEGQIKKAQGFINKLPKSSQQPLVDLVKGSKT